MSATSCKYVAGNGREVWLRPAVEEDAGEFVWAVDSVSREGLYSLCSRFEVEDEEKRTFIADARGRGDLILVAIVDDRLVGWVTLFRARAEFQRHTAELEMGVIRGYRGIGIGSALMDYTLTWAAEHGIEKVKLRVRASNDRAWLLYRKFGFVEEGVRLRDVKDMAGRYDDNVEMAWFAHS